MSMARRRAVVMSHAPGLSGIPCCGHFSSAVTRLSWTTSSARSKSPRARTNAAVSRPASSRKTAATAASAAACVRSAVRSGLRISGAGFLDLGGVIDNRLYLDDAALPTTWPRLGHCERLVQILYLDNGEPADHLFGFDEWAVRDDCVAVLEANGRRAAWTKKLFTTDDPARLAVVFEPLVHRLVSGRHLVLGHLLPHLLVFNMVRKHQDVLHLWSPFMAVSNAASSTRRTGRAEFDMVRSR